MKRIITLIAMVFLMGSVATAQQKSENNDEVIVSHTVELGESVLLICKKYVVLPQDFYKYNKEAIHGVKENTVLRIPLHKSKSKAIQAEIAANREASYNSFAATDNRRSGGPKKD